MDLLLQFGFLLLLLADVVAGYWYWVRPHQNKVGWQGILLLMLTVLTFAGGFIGGFGWWANDSRAFAWALPPLAARMLGVAAWSFALLNFLVLERPTVRRLRLSLIATLVYLLPIALAAVIFHLDRFDFGKFITYGFFTVVLLMIPASMWFLWRQPIILPNDAIDEVPAKPLVTGWLALVAVITSLWGAALFLSSDGGSDLIWVWKGDLLTSRLIAVMLFTIAAGALYSLRHYHISRLMLVIISFYGLGVAVANLTNALSDKPIKLSYVVGFGIMGIVSLLLLVRDRLQTA